MDDLLIGIGKHIKDLRKKNNITISSLAQNAEVSNGLVSRIENGRTIPSLPVLLRLISGLGIETGKFFNELDVSKDEKIVIIKKSEQQRIEKEIDTVGFSYFHIFGKHINTSGIKIEILKLDVHSHREKLITDAMEFKYIIEGSCSYQLDEKEYILEQGDSIFFDGRIPHVPINKNDTLCTMLVIYFFFET